MAKQQRCAIEFCVRLGKSGYETLQLIQAYGNDAMRRAAVFKWWKRFRDGETNVKTNLIAAGVAQRMFHYLPEACGKRAAARFREVGGAL
jgi:hypothetical protein